MHLTHVLHPCFWGIAGNWFALTQLGAPPIVLSHVWMRKRPYSNWGAFLRDDNCMFSFHLFFYLSVESPINVHRLNHRVFFYLSVESQSFCGMTTACSHFILFSISWQSTFGVHTLMNRVHALFVFHFVFQCMLFVFQCMYFTLYFHALFVFCIHTHGIQCMLFDSDHILFRGSPNPLKKD